MTSTRTQFILSNFLGNIRVIVRERRSTAAEVCAMKFVYSCYGDVARHRSHHLPLPFLSIVFYLLVFLFLYIPMFSLFLSFQFYSLYNKDRV